MRLLTYETQDLFFLVNYQSNLKLSKRIDLHKCISAFSTLTQTSKTSLLPLNVYEGSECLLYFSFSKK